MEVVPRWSILKYVQGLENSEVLGAPRIGRDLLEPTSFFNKTNSAVY